MMAYQECEHLDDTGSGYTSHPESTSGLVETSCAGCDSSSTIAPIRQRSVDEIVERSNGTIVGCSFGEFNQTHGPSCETKSQLFLEGCGRAYDIGAGTFLNVNKSSSVGIRSSEIWS